nr:retrovirus-related Pol polyprotein from transposon TNT 1-94 [Tanacetum cinerariifolium]
MLYDGYGDLVSLPNKDPCLSFRITFAMSTQQDIYAAGFENRPPMLNKENYVSWPSRLLRYAKSRPNGKLIHNSIINGPYVRRMILEPGDTNSEVPVNETFHMQTNDELTKKELKQIEADDQAIQTILLDLPEDIYAAVDSYETAQEIWLRVQQMMKGSEIGIQKKKAKLFNEWERFTSNDMESIESYYQRFLKLMNDLKRNKHFPEKIARNANHNLNGNGNLVAARAEGNAIGHNGIQLQAKEFDIMAVAADLDEIEEVNANCILMANLQQASISGTQTDRAPVYESDGSDEVHNYKDCYDNEIFNMFTQEEQYTELLEPIPESHQVPQNDNNVISKVTSVEQSGGTVEQHPANVEETRALYDSLYHNLAIEVEKVNTVNRKLKETNAELTTELARYKNQEKCFEISQEKYDKLERYFQKSVYQEKCFSKKINALYLSSGKQIMTLNEEISDLNKQPLKEKSTVFFLLEEKKKLKSDFKIHEDELLDKQIQLEKRIKELDNILVKTGKSIQTIHMLSLKPDSFYHTEEKMALEETLQLAQESRQKMKQLKKEIKAANYTKINHLSGVFVSLTAKSREELYFLDTSKMAYVSKPNEEFSDDTTPSVASKFVGDFKSLAKEADESLAKHRVLELEIERLLIAVVSYDIMYVVQNNSVGETSNLQTELERTKEHFENCIIKKRMNMLNFRMIGTKSVKNANSTKFHMIKLTMACNKRSNGCKLSWEISRDNTSGTSTNTKFAKQSILGKPPKLGETRALSKPVTSSSIPTPQELKVMKNNKVIAPGMFRINTFKTSKEEKHVPNKVRASVRTKPITVSQPPVFTKKDVNSDSNGLSSTGIDNTKTRRPQPRSNIKNDRVPSASKGSYNKNKGVEVEEHHRNLLLPKNKKHMSSACNNVKLATQNVKSKVVCAMCKQCLIYVNHDVCLLNYFNGKTSRGKKQKANVSIKEKQKKQQLKVVQLCLWCVDSGCSKHMTENLKLLINFVWKFLGTVRFENDHVAAILGFGDLQSGNILITRVYFIEGLGHNLFSVGQFCDSDLEVAFRRNTCFVRNLEGVYLLKGNRTTNLYTINLHDMASASPICLMARASSNKSWLWHQRLSHLNFDTINDLSKNDLVSGLPKFKYHKEHLCPSCEQGKSKRAPHPPKPVPNSSQSLHLLHMDLCGPMRIASINGKRYVLVIMDDYSQAARTMLIFSRAPLFLWAEAIATACFTQNRSIIHRRFNKTPYELINGKKPDISLLYVFGALCYPKNDRKDIRKLGEKGDIGFFIGYSADSCAYRIYNRRTKNIMETMNVSFDELSAMAFELRSSKPRL